VSQASDNERVHLDPHRPGRYPGRKRVLGAVLPRAWYSGALRLWPGRILRLSALVAVFLVFMSSRWLSGARSVVCGTM
jgi:hypothetical protein